MRLTSHQITVLKAVAAEIFGPNVQLFLFGSRVDDQRRGGDIDLYVAGFNRPVEEQLDAKLRFLVKVKSRIGERRIDVVFAPVTGQPPAPIQQMAERTSILL